MSSRSVFGQSLAFALKKGDFTAFYLGNPFRKQDIAKLKDTAADTGITLSLEGCDVLTHAQKDNLHIHGR